jgi:hypothetical protein
MNQESKTVSEKLYKVCVFCLLHLLMLGFFFGFTPFQKSGRQFWLAELLLWSLVLLFFGCVVSGIGAAIALAVETWRDRKSNSHLHQETGGRKLGPT